MSFTTKAQFIKVKHKWYGQFEANTYDSNDHNSSMWCVNDVDKSKQTPMIQISQIHQRDALMIWINI
jgi:hypothetical protein